MGVEMNRKTLLFIELCIFILALLLVVPVSASTTTYVNDTFDDMSGIESSTNIMVSGGNVILPTAWNISTASYLQSFSVAAQELNPMEVFFKPDGTKMYVVGTYDSEVNEYDLSTAWNVSTATYLQTATTLADPTGIFFKPDGTKMYVVSSSIDQVYEYDLSTAWNVSTRVFPPCNQFSVVAQDSVPTGVFFESNGVKMYVVGQDNDTVCEYDLSTPWDVSTASYSQSFSVGSQDSFPSGVFFKDDGTKMYIMGWYNDQVHKYDLSTPWDVSTATYIDKFSVAAQETDPTGVYFKSDGTKMYVVGHGSRNVNEYDLSFLTGYLISTTNTIPSNILTVTPTITDSTPTGTSITYYCSNDDGATWESVTSGVEHTFTSTGNEFKWRADLTTTDNTVTPTISDISFKIFSNALPSVPTHNSPDNDSYVSADYQILNYTSTDADGDTITYYVYADTNPDPTTLV